jgi:hypothetical protein
MFRRFGGTYSLSFQDDFIALIGCSSDVCKDLLLIRVVLILTNTATVAGKKAQVCPESKEFK